MKKIRAGNDIQITWNIFAKNGSSVVPYDVTGAEVWLINALKESVPFEYTITGNTVTGTYYGKDQHTMGKYRLLLVKNADEEGMVTLDATDAFILTCVSKFGVVEGNDEGVVETATVELESQTNITVGGGGDMSDYYTKAETNILLATKSPIIQLNGHNLSETGVNKLDMSTFTYVEHLGTDNHIYLGVYNDISAAGNLLRTYIMGQVESLQQCYTIFEESGNSAVPTCGLLRKVIYSKKETDNLLTGKQATLISGTNIKTINNESILGSGNITIQGGGDFIFNVPLYMQDSSAGTEVFLKGGNNTIISGIVESGDDEGWSHAGNSALPTIDAVKSKIDLKADASNVYTKTQTDNLLTGKQATLISGTNIKTVNGNSILGSGDIVTPNTTYSSLPNTALVMNSNNEFYVQTDDEGPIERVFDFANNGENEWENLGDYTDTQQPGNNVNGDVQLATLKYTAYNTCPDFEIAEYDNGSGTLKINHSYCISISEDNQFEYTFDTSGFDTAKPNKIGYVNIILSLDTTGLQGPQISFGVPKNSNITVFYMSGSKDFLDNYDNKEFAIDASFKGERQFNIMVMYNSHWHEMYVNIAEIDL